MNNAEFDLAVLSALRGGDIVEIHRAMRDSARSYAEEADTLEEEIRILQARLAAREAVIDRQQTMIHELLRRNAVPQ